MISRPLFWLVAVGVVLADQLSKEWALRTLSSGRRVDLLGDQLGLQLVHNDSAALGLGSGMTWLITIVVVPLTVGIVVLARRAASSTVLVLLGLALGGAVGNLIDRLLRSPGFGRGHVVDMIAYSDFFVGNVADIAVVGAAGVAIIMAARGKELLVDGKSSV